MDKARTLEDLMLAQYGVTTHDGPNSGTVVVGLTAVRLCGINPNRVGLIFTNNGTQGVYVYPGNQPSVNNGILLPAAGGVIAFDWKVDFDLLAQEWWAIVSSGSETVGVFERVTL